MDSIAELTGLPGDGLDMEDITAVFTEAALEMNPETMYFMEGFTLMDAMSAFEIGEPRLDTGFVGDRPQEPFNPLAPLLPAEICWILDRALAYEMEWHSGNMLAHTVFTLTYIYHLSDIDADSAYPIFLSDYDLERPIELVTTVLGSCLQGILKCIDLTWRELHTNDLIQDSEDWQSDKCEVPVLEGVPTHFVVERLETTALFVCNSPKIQDGWRQPLLTRILLRKTLLELFSTTIYRQHVGYQRLLSQAREYLQYLQLQNPVVISEDSPAHAAFDPYISRRLNTSVPVRVIPSPSNQETLERLSSFLEGLQEMKQLVLTHQLTTWEVVGKLRMWLKDAPRPAYVRSMTQTTFYGGVLILDQFTFAWALDRIFNEATGRSWTGIAAVVKNTWTRPSLPATTQIERRLYKLITYHIKSMWANLPRLRRYLMKSVVEWHAVYDLCVGITDSLPPEANLEGHIVGKLPQIILSFRLEAMREIVLSGFQLELYAPEERSHAYWYTSKIIEAHLQCYDDLLPFIYKDSLPYKETVFRQRLLLALASLSTAMFLVTISTVPSSNLDQTRAGFMRRYKWAYRPDYFRTRTPAVAHPDLDEFMRSFDEDEFPPLDHVQFARKTIEGLLESQNVGGWAGQWAQDRVRFLRGLLGVCEDLSVLPNSLMEAKSFDSRRRLKWDPTNAHPWFPTVLPAP